jgi:DNA-binding CsgD family transcriptional regulator
VARLAATGRSNREIAEELVVSVRTVENHLQRAYDKLGISGRDELAAALSGAGG